MLHWKAVTGSYRSVPNHIVGTKGIERILLFFSLITKKRSEGY